MEGVHKTVPGLKGTLKKEPNSHEGTISWRAMRESPSSLSDLKCTHWGPEIPSRFRRQYYAGSLPSQGLVVVFPDKVLNPFKEE